jgi:hypothetical protein
MPALKEGYSMPSTENPIATAQREQREAAARYIADGHPLAELGMGDWFAEEFILMQEARP